MDVLEEEIVFCVRKLFSHLYASSSKDILPHVLRDNVLDANYSHSRKNLKVRERPPCGSKLTEMLDSVAEGAMQLMLSPALWCGWGNCGLRYSGNNSSDLNTELQIGNCGL